MLITNKTNYKQLTSYQPFQTEMKEMVETALKQEAL